MKPDLPRGVFLAAGPESFRSLLLAWFGQQGRSLPWRRRRTLYGTWISEVMLQQTTVAAVVPYWKKFLAAFPDIDVLAAADPQEVLAVWSGLGYYRRAVQLHRAAGIVAGQGKLPTDLEGWLALPGVGPYTGGAIASIGLGIRTPALDVNARRVLTRWLVADQEGLAELRPGHLDRVGEMLVDPGRPGDWNEALMELGALVCRASTPECGACPVEKICRAGRARQAGRIPGPSGSIRPVRGRLGVLVLAGKGEVFLMPPGSSPVVSPGEGQAPIREDVSGLHPGLWGLPSTTWLPPIPSGRDPWPGSVWRPWLASVPAWNKPSARKDPVLLGTFSHSITRYRLEVAVYVLRLPESPAGPAFAGHGKGGTSVRGAGFFPFPPVERPVSNLVNKSLGLAAKSIV